ncbi:MAG: hypothetical protein JW917_10580 [Ignavibacteria bacterium]|nr:hypothetical protein [Ignavibacteria bacterium]
MRVTGIIILLSFISISIYAQNDENWLKNIYFKFSFEFPANISTPKIVETSGKMSTSYTFEKFLDYDTIGVLLVAFKWKDIKSLSDFIYLMEKEVSFNFPERIDEYIYCDSVYYDYKIGEYKNNKLHHFAFFYRTKDETQDFNYTYMLKFKVHTESYTERIKDIIYQITSKFRPEK